MIREWSSDAPRACPSSYRSSPTTLTPRRAPQYAAAEPNAPSPTTPRSYRSRGLLSDASSHHREGLVDRDLGAALQHRTALGHLDRGVQGVRADDRVAAGAAAAIADGALGRDALRCRCERVAPGLQGGAALAHPDVPRLHHVLLLFLRLGHRAAAVQEQVIRHRVLPRSWAVGTARNAHRTLGHLFGRIGMVKGDVGDVAQLVEHLLCKWGGLSGVLASGSAGRRGAKRAELSAADRESYSVLLDASAALGNSPKSSSIEASPSACWSARSVSSLGFGIRSSFRTPEALLPIRSPNSWS